MRTGVGATGPRSSCPAATSEPVSPERRARDAVFDLDGTLLDSDEALVGAFVALGVPAAEVTFGHVVDEECARLGLDPADYLAAYDPERAQPFAGVDELLARLDVWAVCSNKHGPAGRAELARLGWRPAVARFADDFGGPKRLGPVLDALGCDGRDVVFVGDTGHDRLCAREVGCRFALAGWNPRAFAGGDGAVHGDIVLRHPLDLLGLLDLD